MSSTHFVKRPPSDDHSGQAHWVPNTDVYKTDAGIVIKIEMAGMRKEDLELMIEGSRIKISGNRPDCCRAPRCTFQVMEIHYGHFETSVEVPPGYDVSRSRAAYQNGFLRIDVPMSAAGQRIVPVDPG